MEAGMGASNPGIFWVGILLKGVELVVLLDGGVCGDDGVAVGGEAVGGLAPRVAAHQGGHASQIGA